MAKLLPHEIRAGTDLLEAYRIRTGKATTARELRVSANGWTSQMIVANGALSDVNASDMEPYFNARRVLANAPIRAAFTSNVQAARKLRASHDPGRNSWNLTIDAKLASWNEQLWRQKCATWQRDLNALGVVFRAEIDGAVFGPLNTHVFAGAFVPSWEYPLSQGDMKVATLPRDVRARALDPTGWFIGELAACGIDVGSLRFIGYIDMAESETMTVGSFDGVRAWRKILNTPGYTTIVGPADLMGRAPKWICAKLANADCLCVDFGPRPRPGLKAATALNWSGVSIAKDWVAQHAGKLRLQAYRRTNNAGILDDGAGGATINDLRMDIDQTTFVGKDFTVSVRAPSMPLNVNSTGNTPFTGGRPLSDAIGALAANATGIGSGLVDLAWYVVTPRGFDLLRLYNVSSADVSSSARILLTSGEVHVGLPMTYVHAKLIADRDSTSDPVLKKKYEDAIKGLTPYIDALARLCVVNGGLPFPRVVDYEKLELRRMANEADQNFDALVVDEKSGLTMRKVAESLSSRRSAGERWVMASKLYDEALSSVDLTTPELWSELQSSNGDHTMSATGIVGEMTYKVTFVGGATFTVDEIGYAIAACRLSDVAAGDAALQAIGFEPAAVRAELADLTAAGAGSVFGIGVRNGPSPDGLAFSHSAFCDQDGVPIMRWGTDDAYIRASMLFNMGGEKVDGILASTFFANTLDVA